MDITVFYAWQDDRPGKYTRYLIRDAAKDACRRISEDPANDYTVALDEATLGVPGMCDIPNTILEKIQACDVFLADLTFVGKTDADDDGNVQLTSNPNVLFELGYAAHAKSFDRILGVMNVAYREPERQMFDVKRRWAITYNLAEDSGSSELQRARKELSKEIEQALLTILDKAVLPDKAEKASQRFELIRTEFESCVREGSFHGLERGRGTIAITLTPTTRATFEHANLQKLDLIPGNSSGLRRENYGKSVVWIYEETGQLADLKGEQVRCSISEIDVEGAIRAADILCLHPGMRPERLAESKQFGRTIPSSRFEGEIVASVSRYGKALNALHAPLPWWLGVSLLQIRGYRMYVGPLELGREMDDVDDIIAPSILIRNPEDVSDRQAVGRLLKDAFDYIWRECGFQQSANYDAEGNWTS